MKNERDKLLTQGANLAVKRLTDNSCLAPFGVALQHDGEVICIEPEEPTADAEDALNEICNHLRSLANQKTLVATAIVSDVKLFDKLTHNCDDAIRVELDDVDSSPVTCYVPYSVRENGLETEEVMAVGGGRKVF